MIKIQKYSSCKFIFKYKNNKDYKGMLYHYLKIDYKLYREFIIYFFENENLNTNKKVYHMKNERNIQFVRYCF